MIGENEKKIPKGNLFQAAWKDPVWSKVISAGIIAIIVALYSGAEAYMEKKPFYETLIDTFKI